MKEFKQSYNMYSIGRLFTYYSYNGIIWFRIFGVGLHFKDTSRNSLIFSERNGYKKALKIGNWRISFLSL